MSSNIRTSRYKAHLDHLEDLPLFYGLEGLEPAIDWVHRLKDGEFAVTQKIDGSPSVFFGWDTEGRPFVGKKSVLNKTSIKYYSYVDIDNHIKDGKLAAKLKHVFTAFKRSDYSETNPPSDLMFQGDFLFGPGDITPNRTFKPNVIEYPLPERFDTNELPVGVAIHTIWDGGLPSFCNDSTWMPKLSHVYTPSLTLKRYEFVDFDPSVIQDVKLWIQDTYQAEVVGNPKFQPMMEKFVNQRLVGTDTLPRKSARDFIIFAEVEMAKHCRSLTQPTAISKASSAAEAYRRTLDAHEPSLSAMFHAARSLRAMRRQVFDHYKPYTVEGVVIADVYHEEAIKIVDREWFSVQNHNANLERGWVKK